MKKHRKNPPNDPNQLTKHHIIPRSRIGKKTSNTVLIPRQNHQWYHNLFSNMVPEEIMEYLNHEFWKEQYDITIKRKYLRR